MTAFEGGTKDLLCPPVRAERPSFCNRNDTFSYAHKGGEREGEKGTLCTLATAVGCEIIDNVGWRFGKIPQTQKGRKWVRGMKKIPTLFKRIYDDGGAYGCIREVTPGCEWVLEGKGEATEKVDGSAVARIGGVWYKRFDAKDGRKIPAGSIACSPRRDPITGHWPHWAIADMRNPSNRWLSAAIVNTPWIGEEDGTFELVGKHIQGNPYGLDAEFLERHGRIKIKDCPRNYDGIKEYLRTHEIEGIVWHRGNGEMCKIKRRDFGFEWPVKGEQNA